MYFEIMRRFEQGNKLPLLDPIDDMEIDETNLNSFVEAKGKVEKQIILLGEPKLGDEDAYRRKLEIKKKVEELEESIKKASEMIMKTDLVNMKRVMRRLDLCDKNDVPTMKGKVAAHISAADEILVNFCH